MALSPGVEAVLAVAALLAAVGGASWLVADVLLDRHPSLDDRLSPYGADPVRPTPAPRKPAGALEGGLVQTGPLRKAVELTGRLADRQGITENLSIKLDQADVPVRPGEALFLAGACTLLAGAFGFVLLGPIGALLGLAAAVAIPLAALNLRIQRRRQAFGVQLVDMLQLLAGALRAGFSLPQAADAVCGQVKEPMGKELRRALSESRLGRPIEDSLDEMADRMASRDFACAATGIRVQREVGGNLAELLDTIVETMVSRTRLRREVKALTAEGRISAIIIGILPVALGLVMYASNQSYMSILFHRRSGEAMLLGSLILGSFGFYWMKKTIEIEV